MRTRFVVITLVVVAGLAAVGWLYRPLQLPRAADRSAEAPVPAELTVKQIMTALVDPQADALWGSVGTIVTKAGTEEVAPKTDAQWSELADHAARLGEAAKLLEAYAHPPNPLSGPPGSPGVHVVSGPVDPREWIAVARALGSASGVALGAVRARGTVALFDAGETLAEACDACHRRFWDDVNVAQ